MITIELDGAVLLIVMGCTTSSNTAICHILSEHTNMSSLIEDYKNLGLFRTSKR